MTDAAGAFFCCQVLSLFLESFANVVYKLHLMRVGLSHLLFSTDKKWKKLPDAAQVKRRAAKRIIFVRHGKHRTPRK